MGKSLSELMGWPGPLTHRQYLAWTAYFAEEWNRPSRTDNYLMQIAAEVRRVLSKKPNSIKLKHFLLKFGSKSQETEMTVEEATKVSKARWFGMLDGIFKKKQPQPERGEKLQ